MEELAHLCGSFGYHLTKDEVASVLKNLDKDDDSRVDFDEFWTWWSSTGQKIQPGLHARVLFARGSMYANRLFKETVDEKMNSNAATTLRLFGEVQNPKMGSIFEVNTDPDALAHVRTTDELVCIATSTTVPVLLSYSIHRTLTLRLFTAPSLYSTD